MDVIYVLGGMALLILTGMAISFLLYANKQP